MGGRIMIRLVCGLICALLPAVVLAQQHLLTFPKDPVDLSRGCDWVNLTKSGLNRALPETNAAYFLAVLPSTPEPGTVVRVEGVRPNARYFSLHLYNGFGKLRDHLADADLTFKPAAPRDTYAVTVVYGPEQGKANTLYTGREPFYAGGRSRRKLLVFRTYLAPPDNASGGPLPSLIVVKPDGTDFSLDDPKGAAACQTLIQNAKAAQRRANDRTGRLLVNLTALFAPAEPNWRVFHRRIGELYGRFINYDNAFMYAKFSKARGHFVVVQMQAPRVSPGDRGSAQVRYWSMCSNEPDTTRVVACLADSQVSTDSDGNAVFVVAPEHYAPALKRIDNLPVLPWSQPSRVERQTSLLIYRQLLADPGFKHAIANVGLLQSAERQMGTYFPQASYCSLNLTELSTIGGAEELVRRCEQAQTGGLLQRLFGFGGGLF